jgi:hypothetical protein
MTVRVVKAIVRGAVQTTRKESSAMEPMLMFADELDEGTDERLLVHAWRAEQLARLGLPHALAEAFADRIDWHALAELVTRGCSPVLALEIVR